MCVCVLTQQEVEAHPPEQRAEAGPAHVAHEASEMTEEEQEHEEQEEGLSPQQHEYDSIGRTRSFYGDVSMPGVLARAARARAYKKELIVFVSPWTVETSMRLQCRA